MPNINLDELIGNQDIKTQIKIALGVARLHNKSMPHTLLTGLPGTGKTSTAKAIAISGQLKFIEIGAKGIKTAEDLASIFEKLPGDGYSADGRIIDRIDPPVLFIDEAHNLSVSTQEMLGIAMEEWKHSFTYKAGRVKEKITTWVPHFTLICATTKEGSLSKPFRDRFELSYVFGEYSLSESIKVVELHAKKLGIEIEEDAVVRIAQRGRGTPRILYRYLKRVCDSMNYLGKDKVTIDITEAAFRLIGVDPEGLMKSDIKILETLYEHQTPVGIETLAIKINQDKQTIQEVCEPYLLKLGLMERSKQGRIITEKGIGYLTKYNHIAPVKTSIPTRMVRVEN